MRINIRKILEIGLMISIVSGLWIYDEQRNKLEFISLRTEELVLSTEGKIVSVTNYKLNMKTYVYSYFVNGEKLTDLYRSREKINGIKKGSPVQVVYLKEDPTKSRLVWTKEDFNWIEE